MTSCDMWRLWRHTLIRRYLVRYQFYQKIITIKSFQYKISELISYWWTLYDTFENLQKKWHFNGKFEVKICICADRKKRLFWIFYKISYNWWDRRLVPILGYISFNLTVLFYKKPFQNCLKIPKRPYKRRLRFFLHG